jgi:hypothetical protein
MERLLESALEQFCEIANDLAGQIDQSEKS